MKLGFFTMPIHPLGKDWRQSLREDREAFVLADELGFTEGYSGSPNKVVDALLAFHETTGGFGTLLYAGKDWKDRDLGRRSMILMAEKVLPAVNAALGRRKTAEG